MRWLPFFPLAKPCPSLLQVPVNFTWVCSSQRFYHPKFLQAFAHHGLKLLQNPTTAAPFDDMHIATTLHGFASHTVEADDAVCWEFIRALADRAVNMLEDFRPQVCTELLPGHLQDQERDRQICVWSELGM